MKNLSRTYQEWLRFAAGALLLAAALIGSGFIIHLPYVPAGLLLVISVNLLMFRSEKQNLSAIGFDLRPQHLLLIPFGLLLGMGSYLLSFYAGTVIRGDHIKVNGVIYWLELLKQLWW